ncbi:MAG: hypothetical protein HPY66_2116 [Firmicutes bacterium]|nr:hypothetical protein [Bacillota bacterium]MDI6705875.1 MoaD/ThiS family protein [Bacillota bacterium]
MEQIEINVELFGPIHNKPGNRLIKVCFASGSSLLDLIERISVNYDYDSEALDLIKKSIIEKKDISSCVILLNGKRILDYDELCFTKLQEGNTVTLMPPIVAG